MGCAGGNNKLFHRGAVAKKQVDGFVALGLCALAMLQRHYLAVRVQRGCFLA